MTSDLPIGGKRSRDLTLWFYCLIWVLWRPPDCRSLALTLSLIFCYLYHYDEAAGRDSCFFARCGLTRSTTSGSVSMLHFIGRVVHTLNPAFYHRAISIFHERGATNFWESSVEEWSGHSHENLGLELSSWHPCSARAPHIHPTSKLKPDYEMEHWYYVTPGALC